MILVNQLSEVKGVEILVFSSTTFCFFFLPIAIFGYFFVYKNRNISNAFLFIMSLLFYSWGNIRYLFLILSSILFNWWAGLSIGRSKKCLNLVMALIVNLGGLFYFKYYGFAVQNVNWLFGTYFHVANIALPLGISFFTFQALSYVIDVYRGEVQAQKSILCVGLYISFFPQLVAGPIIRYKDVEYAIANRKESVEKVDRGILRFITGFSKKVLVANTLAVLVDKAYTWIESGMDISLTFGWIVVFSYAFQIYFDFSGYSDMAIGLANIFGFEFCENFNMPYRATGLVDFWRRWHISLGNWFRDYVYFPLGGSRNGKKKTIFNLFVVWFLTGIWHGADWSFVLWGIGHLLFIYFEKYTILGKKVFQNDKKWISRIITFGIVSLLWVLFRAESISIAFSVYKSILGISSASVWMNAKEMLYVRSFGIYFLLACLVSFMTEGRKCRHCNVEVWIAFLIAVCYMIKGMYNPFIYFNF